MPRWGDENRTPLGLVRANSGLTIEKAAVAIDIASRTLSRYENGVSDMPMSVAEKLSELYCVPFEIIRQAVKDTWALHIEKVAR